MAVSRDSTGVRNGGIGHRPASLELTMAAGVHDGGRSSQRRQEFATVAGVRDGSKSSRPSYSHRRLES
ncbi:hypothetical protein Ancab_030539 [Ancistrocladus abbreviatus]